MQQPPAKQPVQKGPDGAVPCDPPALQIPDPSFISAAQIQDEDQHSRQPKRAAEQNAFTPPQVMHFPHCRLEITTIPASDLPTSLGSAVGKVERVALPGHLVRTLLSRFERGSHSNDTTQAQSRPTREMRVQIQRHFDDEDEWVYSRCILDDFTGFREDVAEVLSREGGLCCWANVRLRPEGHAPGDKWELEFVVQLVRVRDPQSGWCECF